MRDVRWFLVALLCCARASSPAGLPAQELSGELTSGVQSDYLFSNRLALTLLDVKIAAVDVREGAGGEMPGEAVYQAVGLQSPRLLLGPVERQGLHRLIGNPLGYTASSSALVEATRLRLDSSFSPAPREAASLRLFRERLQASALRHRDGRIAGDLYLRPTEGVRLTTELFVRFAEVMGEGYEDTEEESWFLEERPRADGTQSLTTAVIELRGHAGTLRLFFGGASSTGLPPGSYGLLLLQHSWGSFDLRFLAGRQSGYYPEEDGEYGTYRDRLGAVADFREGPAEFTVAQHYRRSHPTLDGGSVGAREHDTNLDVDLLLFQEPRTPLEVSLGAFWEQNALFDEDDGRRYSEWEREIGYGATTDFQGALEARLRAEHAIRYVGPPRRRLTLGAELELRSIALTGEVEWEADEGPITPNAGFEAAWTGDSTELRLETSYHWPEPGSDQEPEALMEFWLVRTF